MTPVKKCISWFFIFILTIGFLGLYPEFTNAAPFYKGKTFRLIVATKPGGGYDAYARLLALGFKKHLPGSSIIVDNIPGAGHIVGTNAIFLSKPDGLTFGTFNKALISAQIVGRPGIRFDLSKMTWLGTPTSESRLFMISSKAPFKTIDDIKNSNQKCLLASSGVGSAAHTDALIIARILKLKNLKIVKGYMGTEAEMAMMRGEIHGTVGSSFSMMPLIKSKDAYPVLAIGKSRLKECPEVPLLKELAPQKYQSLVSLMNTQAIISRPFAGPPKIPAKRYKILQEAFYKTWHDPEIVSKTKRMGLPVDYIGGKKLFKIVDDALHQPSEVVKFLKEISSKR